LHDPFATSVGINRLVRRKAPLFSTTALVAAALFVISAPPARAAVGNLETPTGGQVVGGSATISLPQAGILNINQSSDRAVINWNTFNIGSNATTQFFQPNSGSLTVNRVTGGDPAQILGTLKANGTVMVLDRNGVIFGKDATIDVGGIVASTGDIGTASIMNGDTRLALTNFGSGSVVNNATINVADAGLAAFVSPTVINNGIINVKLGRVAFGSGSKVTLDLNGDSLLEIALSDTASSALINQAGTINAQGGSVLMTAQAAKNAVDNVINMSGIVNVSSVSTKGGTIVLRAGTVNITGTLDASAPNGGDGGFIETSGDHVSIADISHITTVAPYGKTGHWLIDPPDFMIAASGGDISGAALSTGLANNSVTILSSSGTTAGNGDIFVNDAVSWSTNNTLTLSAYRNVNVNANITATGNTAGLTLTPNTGGLGGSYSLNNGAAITLSGSTPALNIAGQAYTVINSLTALQNMNLNLAGYYALGSNIDATATSGWNAGAGFAPVGYLINYIPTPFTGQFDGLNHTITNLFINRQGDGVGLFGAIGNGSAIRNVGLISGSITGLYDVGGLLGSNIGGTVSNSYATGNVSGNSYVGGLVGSDYGPSITGSYATGNVSGTSGYVGGLVGLDYAPGYVVWGIRYSPVNTTTTISNSYATGNVNGHGTAYYVGGLVGIAYGPDATISNSHATGNVIGGQGSTGGLIGNTYKTTISNAYATGNVSSGQVYTGGLVGVDSYSTFNNVYATGSVVGQEYTGGLVGAMTTPPINNSSSISNAYATGSVSGQNYVGGLLGTDNWVSVSNAYATGNVSGQNYVGGLVGEHDYAPISTSYATGNVSGISYVGGLIGSTGSSTTYPTVISDTYATGSVSGQSYVAGLVAHLSGTINTSYSSGLVSGTSNVGGLVAIGGTVVNSYWDVTGSGQATSAGGIGLTSSQMMMQSSFTGFDFTNTWRIYEGHTAPLLKYFLTPLSITATDVGKNYDGQSWTGPLQVAGYSDPAAAGSSNIYGLNSPYGTASDAGTYNASLWSNQQGYDITVNGGKLTIYPAVVTITGLANALTTVGATAQSKIYDGTTNAIITGESLVGVIGSDNVTISGGGFFADKNVGTNKPVTAALTLGGTDAGNYTLLEPTGLTANITPATLMTSGATAQSKVYDGTINAIITGESLSGVIGSDNVTIGGSGTFADQNAGTGRTVTADLILGGADAGNYTLIEPVGLTANITPAVLTATGATAQSKVYDGTTNAIITGENLSGIIGSDNVTISGGGIFADHNAGINKLVTAALTLGGTDAGNYTLMEPIGLTANITPAALTIKVNNQVMTYGGKMPTLTVNYTGFVSGDSAASLTTAPRVVSGTAASANAGVYLNTLTASGAVDNNYTISYTAGNLTINRANLTVIADNKTMRHGGRMPILTASYVGFVNGDTVLRLTKAATVVSHTLASARVGTYIGTLTASGVVDNNYTISYTAGNLTINR
jgi:filamentous hemagglutinin family protein